MNANALTLINNLYFLEGQLYSGIVYIQQADFSYKAIHVNDGVLGSQYIPFCLQDHTIDITQLAIYDSDHLDTISYAFALNDKLYQGFIVSFYANGHVASEEYYEDGFSVSKVKWGVSGGLDVAIVAYEKWTESICFSDKKIENYCLDTLKDWFILSFDDKKEKLTCIYISAMFNDFNFKVLQLFPLNHLSDILNYSFSDQLLFKYDYVNDQFISQLIQHNKIQHVTKLSLIEVAIEDFSFLLSLAYLKVLEVSQLDHLYNLIEICQQIKSKANSTFKLILNEKEVI